MRSTTRTIGSEAVTHFSRPDAISTGDGTLFATHSEIAVLEGNVVALSHLPKPYKLANAAMGSKLKSLFRLSHQNLQLFIGIVVNDENLCESAVGEVCPKGDLCLLLQESSVVLDDAFKYSLITDLASGMAHLHSTKLISHGDLSDKTCLIDSRFTLKVSGYGLGTFRNSSYLQPVLDHEDGRDLSQLLWRAPEFLRKPMPPNGTQQGDVYAFAILLQQMVLRKPPFCPPESSWGEYDAKARDILLEVKKGSIPPLRPRVPRSQCPMYLADLMDSCWEEDPELRPSFTRIKEILRRQTSLARSNIVDHLIKRLEQYAENLEEQVEIKTKNFMDEKRRGEEILHSLLPKFVAQNLNNGLAIAPETFDSTTVYFSHLDGFEKVVSAVQNPMQLTHSLNSFYVLCDSVLEKLDVYKVETICDAYLVVSGLPIPNGIQHAGIIAKMALTLRDKVSGITFPFSGAAADIKFQLRIGINSGPCVTGIIGIKLPRYCLFGDTINTASRMETSGQAGKIHISTETRNLLVANPKFNIEPRGEVLIKGKGLLATYWLQSMS